MVELHNKGFQIFAYADDLAIMGKGEDQLKRAIEVVEKWTEDNKMKINRKKSGIIFYKRRKSKKNTNHNEEIMGFPRVSEYKYLGL